MFKEKDLAYIKSKGLDINAITQQLNYFKKGFPYADLVEAASINDGIKQFSELEINELVEFFNKISKNKEVIKFVPASGAASRMFKLLFEFMDQFDHNKIGSLLEDKSFNSVYSFLKNIKQFAFYEDLKKILAKNNHNIDQLLEKEEYPIIIDYLLSERGLGYASLPKALLKFHNYDDGARMAIEEHLVEGAVYCKDYKNKVRIHFTVSNEHLKKFEKAIDKTRDKYESSYTADYQLDYSVQKSSTDMIAVDMNNQPLRNEDDELVFRPGGHGALIENLNEIDADIIFVKNIDNIVPDRLREPTYLYKRLIAGHLIQIQQRAFKYLERLHFKKVDSDLLSEIEAFMKNDMLIRLENIPEQRDEHIQFLMNKLNRPIRVCGMVKNEGEPGGGPFWVKNSKGITSLQIVESSQINMADNQQKDILNNATHFNPVDLVCGVRDFRGYKFNLHDYVDSETGFISIKSQSGKELKAQELPGLWNGAMANWITVFVECPIITFNPVKTINDLLREQHQ